MKKHSLPLLAALCLLLCMAMLISLSGCGRSEITEKLQELAEDVKGDDTGSAEDAEEAEETEEKEDEPAEPQAAASQSYHWDEITFELTEVTEDLGDWESQLASPEGKYVLAVFTITDGKIECGRLEELVMTQGNISLDGHVPAALTSQGIAIENDMAYANGTINVFFDVPQDLDPAAAEVIVQESVAAAADAGEQVSAGAEAGGSTEGIALEEGASFQWREYQGSIAKTDTGGIDTGMFVLTPAEMTDDEYCFNLYLYVDEELRDNEELSTAFYEAAGLCDAQGNIYNAQVSSRPSEGADFLFLYAIPNGVATEELSLVFTD